MKIRITIVTVSGKELLLEADVESRLVTEEHDLDGYKVSGSTKLLEDSRYSISKNGKVVVRGDLEYSVFVAREETYRGYTGIGFNGDPQNILISKESFEAIKTAYEEAISKEHSKPEVKEFIEKKEAEEKAWQIAHAKDIVKKAEAQKSIPTAAELRRIQKEWNDVYNEGGEGYVPQMITREQYDDALKVLKTI